MLKKFIEIVILVITVMIMSGASVLGSSIIYLVTINISLLVILVIQRKKIDHFIILLIIWWFIINFISLKTNYGKLTSWGFIGSTMYFIFPYLVIKIIGSQFWDKLEKLLFRMSIITIPIFLLSILIPNIFDSLKDMFAFLTNDIFNSFRSSQENYWYSFFYTHTGRGDLRNSGFMWEPGAFAMILIVMMIYTWIRDGYNIGIRQLIYSICIITTFSTAGYLSLGILLTLAVFKTKGKIVKIILIILITIFLIFIYDAPFMTEKIISFVEQTKYLEGGSSATDENRIEVNRLLSFIINMQQSLLLPSGYGVIELSSKNILSMFVTVNGLGEILVKWGWVGFVGFYFSMYRFLNLFKTSKSNYQLIGFILAISIVFFSNPIINNPILWLIVFTPYIFDSGTRAKPLANSNTLNLP